MPIFTSSTTRYMSYLSQSARRAGMKSGGGTTTPASLWIASTRMPLVSSGGETVVSSCSSMNLTASRPQLSGVPNAGRYGYG